MTGSGSAGEPAHALPWRMAWRIARRDLNARFRGLRLLLVCLFLGVGALAAIGTLTGAVRGELAARGRTFLGGDIEASVWQRAATDRELAAFGTLGTVSGGVRLQAMARAACPDTEPSRGRTAPVQLKAVDGNWPMVGSFTLADGRTAGAPPPGTAWLAQGAADRLGVGPLDFIRIGTATLSVAGIIGEEPDALSEGFALGPTVIVPAAMPAAAGLTQPGAMYRTRYRIAFDTARDPEAAIADLEARFPDGGWEYRTADNAAPGADRFVGRMGEFLSLVGLAALAISGIGIGGGVRSYLDARRDAIATLKVLGATGGDIARIYTLQIGAAALAGSLAGLAAGVAVVPLIGRTLAGLLPVRSGLVIDLPALLRAGAFGLLVATVFAAPPLAAARRVPAMGLLRADVAAGAGRWRTIVGGGAAVPVIGGIALLVALVIGGAQDPWLAAGFLAGAAATLALLAALGQGIRAAARAMPAPRGALLRAGIANLHRPGAQTGALVTALGFGLSAFVLLAAVQTAIDGNIARTVPAQAPDYFVLDLPPDEADRFAAIIGRTVPGAATRTVPALRGRILAYGPADASIRVADLDELPDGAWPLRGERGLTYADSVPDGNTITAGRWWPAGYDGEPLVSVDADLADALDLQLGDYLTIGVLGVERRARIASFRRINWESLGFNYVLVFSPNTLADAPHNLAATIELPEGGDLAEEKATLLRRLVDAFPASSVIEVGPVLDQARALLTQIGTAILAAAGVAVLAGIAVLVGAIAAARAAKRYDTVILRVLGASRAQILAMQLAEYALLCAVLALVALGLGGGMAWAVVTQMFEFDWLPDWPRVLAVLGGGLVLVLGVAIAGSLPLLRARPAAALRQL